MAQEMDLQYCILRSASSERILEGATGSALRATCVSIQHWVEGNIPIISVPFRHCRKVFLRNSKRNATSNQW